MGCCFQLVLPSYQKFPWYGIMKNAVADLVNDNVPL